MLRLALLAVLAAAFALAQPPRGFYPWWDRPVAKTLHLTDAQTRQIRSAVREHRGKLIEHRAALEKAEFELENLFEEETVDAGRANQAIENLARARESLTRTFSQMALQLRLVLTAQQWQELQKRRDGEIEARRNRKRPPTQRQP